MNSTQNGEEMITNRILESTQALSNQIISFKKALHATMVANDSIHDAGDLKAMIAFHSVFLQCIAYWISLLDNALVPKPLLKGELQSKFKSLTNSVVEISNSNSDAYTIVYNMLFQLSTQHPFVLEKSPDSLEDGIYSS